MKNPFRIHFVLGLFVIAAVTMTLGAQERDRMKIADKYKWNLADIYPSDAAWRTAKDKFSDEFPQIAQYKGRLASSATTLADALEKQSTLSKELAHLYVYAGLLADQDTRDSEHQGMRQQMAQIAASFSAQSAYIEPEILRANKASIESFVASEPRLKVYRFYLDDVIRRAPHTLSDAEEKLLADLGPVAGVPSNVYNILSNADFPYPTVTLSDGRTVKVDQAAFTDLRASSNRSDREKVMSSFFKSLGSFNRTFGTTMNGEVQKVSFETNARKYSGALEASLNGPNIPTSVYMRLIDGMNKHLDSFHRYLKLRKRMMGLDELHYFDLYAPLVASVNLKYTPEQAEEHVVAAVAPSRPGLSGDDSPGIQRTLDRSVPQRRQAVRRLLERRRLRRPSLHADQLQRAI